LAHSALIFAFVHFLSAAGYELLGKPLSPADAPVPVYLCFTCLPPEKLGGNKKQTDTIFNPGDWVDCKVGKQWRVAKILHDDAQVYLAMAGTCAMAGKDGVKVHFRFYEDRKDALVPHKCLAKLGTHTAGRHPYQTDQAQSNVWVPQEPLLEQRLHNASEAIREALQQRPLCDLCTDHGWWRVQIVHVLEDFMVNSVSAELVPALLILMKQALWLVTVMLQFQAETRDKMQQRLHRQRAKHLSTGDQAHDGAPGNDEVELGAADVALNALPSISNECARVLTLLLSPEQNFRAFYNTYPTASPHPEEHQLQFDTHKKVCVLFFATFATSAP
jgi:hypothetical protein